MSARLRRLIPTREQLEGSRWLRWLAPWFGQPALWRWSRHGVALGVALGVFFGVLIPLAQIPLSAAAAVVLRANLPAAAASTLVSNPITFAPIYIAAYKLGSALTGEEAAPPKRPAAEAHPSWTQRILNLGKPLLLGLGLMAVAAGLASYAAVSLVWLAVCALRRRRHRTQGGRPATSG